MKIIPTRSMQLGGKDVHEGVAVTVNDADGAYAITSGWAVAARAEAAAEPAVSAGGGRKKAPAAAPDREA